MDWTTTKVLERQRPEDTERRAGVVAEWQAIGPDLVDFGERVAGIRRRTPSRRMFAA